MLELCIIAAGQAAPLFDPADWLERFRAVGGWYVVQGDKVHAGWRLDGSPDDDRAREVWREIEGMEERRVSIRTRLFLP